jgi:hypothetical protein
MSNPIPMDTDPFSEETMDTLVRFVGYGPKMPQAVFLGIEEAGGGTKNIEARLNDFDEIEDLFEAHMKLQRHDADFENPFDSASNPVTQWNTCSIFALALAGLNPDALWRNFWRQCLGRRKYETFLMECYPIPRKGLAHRIRGYSPKEIWCKKRMPVLREFFKTTKPRFVVAYGIPAHDACADLFNMNGPWETVEGTQWSVGETTLGIVVCRVGFFGNGQFNRADLPSVASRMVERAGGPLTLGLPGL